MSKQNLVSKAVRLALVCGVASGFAGKAAFAADQDQNATTQQTNTAQLGKIEVTGSRIKRTDIEQAQPVTVITAAQIKATGLPTVGQIIQKLTSTGASLNTLDNFGGNFTFTGGGESNVDLRNLGAQRVLVLVNGKRWVTALDGTVDLNTIPTSIIDHIEVLQDGASAIYGSDAISGVVNIITVKDYNVREANAYLGEYNGDGHWDGKTEQYDFTMGSSNDKSGLVFNLNYSNQDAILSKDRNISKEPVYGQGNSSGSSGLPNGRFFIIAPPGSTSPICAAGNACDLTYDPTAPNGFRDFVSHGPTSDRFNYAPYNYVLTPEERYSTYLQGYSDLGDNVTFKADMMYSHRDSHQQAAPEPLFFSSSSIAIDIPANQKYNPFGFDLNALDPSKPITLGLAGLRMVDNGVRAYHEAEDVYRVEGGLNGYLNAGGGEWDWDANYAFSKDSELDTNAGHFDVSHLRLALGDPTICAATPGCVQLNIFNGPGGMTQKMLNYVAYTAQNSFVNNQRVYNADISNSSLFSMPGGPAGVAFGVQDLEHDGTFQPDSVAENGYDSFNPGRTVLPTSGRTEEKSEYAELDLPLVADAPGFKLLDLDLAGRHTNYNTYGGNNTYRWGLKYQPNSDWLVRASWSQGFRAPDIQDLFAAGTNLSANIDDPCTTANATTGAPHTPAPTCALKGVPPYIQPNQQINTLEIGNRNLKPETSVSKTLGFVYSPDALPGFNFNADYYTITVQNVIQPLSGQTILDGCYTQTLAQSNAADCALITRTAFGDVETLKDQIINNGALKTDGIDWGFSYAIPSTSIGDFKIELDDTHIKSYTINGQELAGVERGGSVFPFGVPHDKLHSALDWTAGSWSAEYTVRIIGKMTEVSTGTLQPTGNNMSTTVYNDIQGSYNADSLNTTFTAGIRNLWDKNPPISSVQELNSFDPTLYDVPGRFYYFRMSVKF
ncbi:MAG TPA: TonB-dependent receptor [Gammaproteobacteria bacterium]|nr:TonB-dependent receptor [Gammaproteobacteria bacterium]